MGKAEDKICGEISAKTNVHYTETNVAPKNAAVLRLSVRRGQKREKWAEKVLEIEKTGKSFCELFILQRWTKKNKMLFI